MRVCIILQCDSWWFFFCLFGLNPVTCNLYVKFFLLLVIYYNFFFEEFVVFFSIIDSVTAAIFGIDSIHWRFSVSITIFWVVFRFICRIKFVVFSVRYLSSRSSLFLYLKISFSASLSWLTLRFVDNIYV